MDKDEADVMETRRKIRAAAAAVNMQNILEDFDEEEEDDFDVIGGKIKHAFSELGSVTSVAKDVLRMKAKEMKSRKHDYYDYDDDDDDDDDGYDDEDYYDDDYDY